jgi:hypothetical protein
MIKPDYIPLMQPTIRLLIFLGSLLVAGIGVLLKRRGRDGEFSGCVFLGTGGVMLVILDSALSPSWYGFIIGLAAIIGWIWSGLLLSIWLRAKTDLRQRPIGTRYESLPSWIKLCGRLAAFPIHLLLRLALPFCRLAGYRRSRVGTCTFFAPAKQMQVILEGIALLRTLDPAMFQRLTAERRYWFLYDPKGKYMHAADFFMITKSFLNWGKEGVAIYFVQCILDFHLIFLPQLRNLHWNAANRSAARSEIQRQLLDWIKRYSFPAQLVGHYERLTQKSWGSAPIQSSQN